MQSDSSNGGPLLGFEDARHEASFLHAFAADCTRSDVVLLLVGELLHCVATEKLLVSGKSDAAPLQSSQPSCARQGVAPGSLERICRRCIMPFVRPSLCAGAWLRSAAMLPHAALVFGVAALAWLAPHTYLRRRWVLLAAVQLAHVPVGPACCRIPASSNPGCTCCAGVCESDTVLLAAVWWAGHAAGGAGATEGEHIAGCVCAAPRLRAVGRAARECSPGGAALQAGWAGSHPSSPLTWRHARAAAVLTHARQCLQLCLRRCTCP